MVGECVLLVQFHVYRQFHCCGFCVVYPPLEVCPFIRAIGCGALYAGIFRADAAGNMMLEGFWYYLFLGVFQAATIHYMVAKIVGPFLFGRGWCGYAC